MRIIAGEARGHPLIVPPDGVRPTMDRVRGAIFSSLGDAVLGARVADLFAGAGGLGIEALSRGAASAVFVEANPKCVACIKQNLARTKLTGSIQTMDALKFVELYAEDRFDLIFADPPYAKWKEDRDFAAELLTMPAMARAIRDGGTLILERYFRQDDPESCLLSRVRSRRYGESEIAYYTAP